MALSLPWRTVDPDADPRGSFWRGGGVPSPPTGGGNDPPNPPAGGPFTGNQTQFDQYVRQLSGMMSAQYPGIPASISRALAADMLTNNLGLAEQAMLGQIDLSDALGGSFGPDVVDALNTGDYELAATGAGIDFGEQTPTEDDGEGGPLAQPDGGGAYSIYDDPAFQGPLDTAAMMNAAALADRMKGAAVIGPAFTEEDPPAIVDPETQREAQAIRDRAAERRAADEEQAALDRQRVEEARTPQSAITPEVFTETPQTAVQDYQATPSTAMIDGIPDADLDYGLPGAFTEDRQMGPVNDIPDLPSRPDFSIASEPLGPPATLSEEDLDKLGNWQSITAQNVFGLDNEIDPFGGPASGLPSRSNVTVGPEQFGPAANNAMSAGIPGAPDRNPTSVAARDAQIAQQLQDIDNLSGRAEAAQQRAAMTAAGDARLSERAAALSRARDDEMAMQAQAMRNAPAYSSPPAFDRVAALSQQIDPVSAATPGNAPTSSRLSGLAASGYGLPGSFQGPSFADYEAQRNAHNIDREMAAQAQSMADPVKEAISTQMRGFDTLGEDINMNNEDDWARSEIDDLSRAIDEAMSGISAKGFDTDPARGLGAGFAPASDMSRFGPATADEDVRGLVDIMEAFTPDIVQSVPGWQDIVDSINAGPESTNVIDKRSPQFGEPPGFKDVVDADLARAAIGAQSVTPGLTSSARMAQEMSMADLVRAAQDESLEKFGFSLSGNPPGSPMPGYDETRDIRSALGLGSYALDQNDYEIDAWGEHNPFGVAVGQMDVMDFTTPDLSFSDRTNPFSGRDFGDDYGLGGLGEHAGITSPGATSGFTDDFGLGFGGEHGGFSGVTGGFDSDPAGGLGGGFGDLGFGGGFDSDPVAGLGGGWGFDSMGDYGGGFGNQGSDFGQGTDPVGTDSTSNSSSDSTASAGDNQGSASDSNVSSGGDSGGGTSDPFGGALGGGYDPFGGSLDGYT